MNDASSGDGFQGNREENARAVPAAGDDCAELREPLEGSYFVSAYPPFSHWSQNDLPALKQTLAAEHADGDVPFGLYVHVPFCSTRCEYCYYRSYSGQSRQQMDRYIAAVLAELAMYRQTPAVSGRKVDFLYFGGGTPSLLSAEQIEFLFRGMRDIFPWTDAREITFECAPKTVTDRRLAVLADAGVTRISLGAQQLNDDVLRAGGRMHLTRDVVRAYSGIRQVGFDSVNIDLMVGMVGETDESFSESLEQLIEMQPDSVTVYQLEIPPNTPLAYGLRAGELTAPLVGWDVKRHRLSHAFDRLEQADYVVRSAYTAVHDLERHSFIYQDAQYSGADVIGAGVASFSYCQGIHYQNQTSLEDYIDTVATGRLPLKRAYALNEEERLTREFVLQLKLGKADRVAFQKKFCVDIGEHFSQTLEQFTRRDWVHVDDDAIVLTREGLLRVDRMIPEFYPPRIRESHESRLTDSPSFSKE